jgi:hypothetical protein
MAKEIRAVAVSTSGFVGAAVAQRGAAFLALWLTVKTSATKNAFAAGTGLLAVRANRFSAFRTLFLLPCTVLAILFFLATAPAQIASVLIANVPFAQIARGATLVTEEAFANETLAFGVILELVGTARAFPAHDCCSL